MTRENIWFLCVQLVWEIQTIESPCHLFIARCQDGFTRFPGYSDKELGRVTLSQTIDLYSITKTHLVDTRAGALSLGNRLTFLKSPSIVVLLLSDCVF